MPRNLFRWSALSALCLCALSPLFAQTLSNQQFITPRIIHTSSNARVGITTAATETVEVISAPVGDGTNGCDSGYPCGDSVLNVCVGTACNSYDLGNNFAYLAALQDLNKDGLPDAIIGEYGYYQDPTFQPALVYYTNQGGGQFKFSGTLGTNIVSLAFDLQDVNRDGYPDLFLVRLGAVEVLLNAKGSFTETDYPVGSFGIVPPRFVLGDLNRDGKTDLIAVGDTGHILLGNGDGTFHQSATFATAPGSQPYLNDLNGDKHTDIATLYGDSPIVGLMDVFLSAGNGSFGWPTTYDFGLGFPSLTDLNGDGKFDLSVVYPDGEQAQALNDGRGSFNLARQTSAVRPDSIVTADFNNDGIGDIAVVDKADIVSGQTLKNGFISTFLGSGKGYFQPRRSYGMTMPSGVIAAGDVNGDGRIDLVVARSSEFFWRCRCQAHPGSTDLAVFLGNSDGSFQAAKNYSVLGPPGGDQSNVDRDAFIRLEDVNLDGKLDLVGDWGVALGKGDGSFAAPIPLPSAYQARVALMAAGDFNRDGVLDLVVAGGNGGLLNLLLGDGKGSFIDKGSLAPAGIFTMNALTVADIDGDGVADLIYDVNTQQPSHRYVSVRLGNGSGGFGPPANYEIQNPTSFAGLPEQLLIGDFNRDGNQDVVLLGSYALLGKKDPGPMALIPGIGGGKLSMTPQYYPNSFLRAVVLDLNGDGAPDLAGTTSTGITRLLNTGSKLKPTN